MRSPSSENDRSFLRVSDKLLSPAALKNFLALLLALLVLSNIPVSTARTQNQEVVSPHLEVGSLKETELRLFEAGLGIYLDFYRTVPKLSETFGSALFVKIHDLLEKVAQGKIDINHVNVQILRDGWATAIDRSAMLSRALASIDTLPDESFGVGANSNAVRELLHSFAQQTPGFFIADGFAFQIDAFFNDRSSQINGKSNGSLITMGDVPAAHIGSQDLLYRLTFIHEMNHGVDGQRFTLHKIREFKKFIPLELFVSYITQYTQSSSNFLTQWLLLPAQEAIAFDAARVTNWNVDPETPSLLTTGDKEKIFRLQEIAKWIEFLGTSQEVITEEMRTHYMTINESTQMRYLAWKVAKRLASDPNPQLRQNHLIASLLNNRIDPELNISMNGIVESIDHTFVEAPNSALLPTLPLLRKHYDLVDAARNNLVAAEYKTPDRLSIVHERAISLQELSHLKVELLGTYQYAPDASLNLHRLPINPFSTDLEYLQIQFIDRLLLNSSGLADRIINPWNFIMVLPRSLSQSLDTAALEFKFDSQKLSSFNLEILHNGQSLGKVGTNFYGEYYSTEKILDVICTPPQAVIINPVLRQEVSTDLLLVPQVGLPSKLFEVDSALAQYFTPGALSLFPLPFPSSKDITAQPFVLLANAMRFPTENDGFVIYSGMLLPESNLTENFIGGYFDVAEQIFKSNSVEFIFAATSLANYHTFKNQVVPGGKIRANEKVAAKIIEGNKGAAVHYFVVVSLENKMENNSVIDQQWFPVTPRGSSFYTTVEQPVNIDNEAQLTSHRN